MLECIDNGSLTVTDNGLLVPDKVIVVIVAVVIVVIVVVIVVICVLLDISSTP